MIDFIPASYVGSFVTNKYIAPPTLHPQYPFYLTKSLRKNSGILAPNAIYRATLDLYHMSECDLP